MKFRKKPIVIEAEQWFPGKEIAGVFTRCKNLDINMEIGPCIDTLKGRMKVSPGDWIITGINGEQYACKPDIFEKTYEPVEE